MKDEDLYRILGVDRSSSEAEIRKAYRKIARDNHPDRRPDDAAAETRFKKASYASEVLLNAKKRKLYDEFGEVGLRDGFDPGPYRAAGGGPGRGGFPGGFGGRGGVNLEDLFRAAGHGGPGVGASPFGGGGGGGGGGAPNFMDAFFTQQGQQGQQGRPGAGPGRAGDNRSRDLVAGIDISFVEALEGTEKELAFEAPPGGGGAGGKRELRVRIPRGVKDGGKVRLRGQGTEGGDLVLEVHVSSHPFFDREDDDLLLDLPVTVGEAVAGAKVQVPTPEGVVALRIPVGVRSGTKLRLRGKGASRGKATGDLIVTVMVIVPGPSGEEGEGPEELAQLAEQIDALYGVHPREALKL